MSFNTIQDDSNLLKLFGLPGTFYSWDQKKESAKGWLGIAMRLAKAPIVAFNRDNLSAGIEVVSAIPHSPGELAGFQMGDVIVGIDGKRFENKASSLGQVKERSYKRPGR